MAGGSDSVPLPTKPGGGGPYFPPGGDNPSGPPPIGISGGWLFTRGESRLGQLPLLARVWTLGGAYTQSGSDYHSDMISWQVPAHWYAEVWWAGFDNLDFAKYTLFVNEQADGLVNDIGLRGWAYVEAGGSPPNTFFYSGKAACVLKTDASLTGVCGHREYAPPLVYGPQSVLRLRAYVSEAGQKAAAWLSGVYYPENELKRAQGTGAAV